MNEIEIQLALTASALSDKETILEFKVTLGTDSKIYISCLKELGADIEFIHESSIKIKPIEFNVQNSDSFLPIINCGDNPAAFRLIIPVIAVLGKTSFISGMGELAAKPFNDIIDLLEPKGCVFRFDHFPFELSGRLSSGRFELINYTGIDAELLAAGLIFSLPLAEGKSTLFLNDELKFCPVLVKAVEIIKAFGIQVLEKDDGIEIPGNQRFISPKKIS